jgi:hypothetical protein
MQNISLQDCQNAAINYVLEECAIVKNLNDLGDYLVYPGKMNPCFAHIHRKCLSGPEEFLQFQEYRLRMCSELKLSSEKSFHYATKSNKERNKCISDLVAKSLPKTTRNSTKFFFSRDVNELLKTIKTNEEIYLCLRRLSL